jgi:PIN domain nuclease of toxin-antitoxin system
MRLLLDTHLLLWAEASSGRLTQTADELIGSKENQIIFSVLSIWEIAVKFGLGRRDFDVEPSRFRRSLLDTGYEELLITSAHAIGVARLPALHKDPFDRLLVAQAISEGVLLLTSDPLVAQYPGPIRLV